MLDRPHGRELHVGVVRDPNFGPVISFGAGGTAVEIIRDRALALPPLNDFMAREIIRETRVARMLERTRDMPAAAVDAIAGVLLRVSAMVCELPHIRELDINPLVADERGALALDCRVVVERPPVTLDPYTHMAIHPYPSHLSRTWQLADGTVIVIRPIRPEDAQIDYDRDMAFIAVIEHDPHEEELGVARYTTTPDGHACEFALVVADAWQNKGIGTQLMTSLMQVARDRGLRSIEGAGARDSDCASPRLGATVRPFS